MRLDILAKQLLLYENTLNFNPQFTGCLAINDYKITNSKKHGLVIYHNNKLENINKFDYENKPDLKQDVANLSIKLIGIDLGFEKTIKLWFSRKRNIEDI